MLVWYLFEFIVYTYGFVLYMSMLYYIVSSGWHTESHINTLFYPVKGRTKSRPTTIGTAMRIEVNDIRIIRIRFCIASATIVLNLYRPVWLGNPLYIVWTVTLATKFHYIYMYNLLWNMLANFFVLLQTLSMYNVQVRLGGPISITEGL